MELSPNLPPGRANRKALRFATEIHRLRAAGYSFAAIRLALREAGVDVSCSTVKREAAKVPAVVQLEEQRRTPPHSSAAILPSPAPTSLIGDSRSGREIAEAFMRDRISNPLLRERIEDEARRD